MRGTDEFSLIRYFLRMQLLIYSPKHSEQGGDECMPLKPEDLPCVGSDCQARKGNVSRACRDVTSRVFSLVAGHTEDLIHVGNLWKLYPLSFILAFQIIEKQKHKTSFHSIATPPPTHTSHSSPDLTQHTWTTHSGPTRGCRLVPPHHTGLALDLGWRVPSAAM